MRENRFLTEIQEFHFKIGVVLQYRRSDLLGGPGALVVRTVFEIKLCGNGAIVPKELRIQVPAFIDAGREYQFRFIAPLLLNEFEAPIHRIVHLGIQRQAADRHH